MINPLLFQEVQSSDGYIIPLSIKDSFTRLDIHPYIDQEFDTLPHVILTSKLVWDPSILDHIFKVDEQWGEAPTLKSQFNGIWQLHKRVILHHNTYFESQDGTTTDDEFDQCIYATHMFNTIKEFEGNIYYDAFQHEIAEAPTSAQAIMTKTTVKRSPDFQLLCPFFGWMSADIIQKAFEHTTQYARLPTGTMLKKAFRSPHPALNVYRCNEDVACDIVYSDVPAIFDSSTTAVIFFGTSSKATDAHVITSLRIPLRIPLSSDVPPIADLVIEAKLSLVIKLNISYENFASTNGKVNHTSTTRIRRNDATRPLRMLPTASLIVPAHPQTYGYFVSSMIATY
jgi:hypothetical protein